MFLPKLDIKTGKRAVIFFPLPEWNYAKENLFLEKSTNFLNLQIRYNEKAIILGPLIGSSFLSIILEGLKKLGIEEIIGVGWAGKMDFRLNKGDLFLPIKAYSLEGVSKFYFPKKRFFTPDKMLFKKIEKELKRINCDFKEGCMVSVDAPFVFERKKEYLEKWKDKAKAMDMETSALFSVSKSLQIKVMALHFIIDEVSVLLDKRPEKEIKFKRKMALQVLRDFLDYKI